MADDVVYGVQLAGAEEAAQQIEDLKVKQAELASDASRLATQVRAAEREAAQATGQASVDAQAKLDGLRRQLIQTQSQAQSYGQQARQLAAAQGAANDSAQQAATRFGAAGAAIGSVGSAIGHLNPLMGQMVSSIGSTVSQIPGLIAQFGALGPAIGAANLAISAWSVIEQAERAAFAERVRQTDRLMRSFQDLSGAIAQAREDQDRWSNAVHAQGSQEDVEGAFARLQALRDVLGRSVSRTEQRQFRGGYAARSVTTAGDAAAIQSLTQGPNAGIPELGLSGAALGTEQARRDALGQVTSELRTLAAALHNREQNVDAAALGRSFFGTTATDTESAADASSRIYARRGGGQQRLFNQNNEYERARDAEQLAHYEEEKTHLLQLERDFNAQMLAIHTQMASLDQQSIDAQLERQRVANERAQELQNQHLEVASDALATFRDASVRSTDDIIAAWNRANDALAAAGREQLSTARLLERGMSAVGNSIADSIGNKITGGIEQSVGAVLDGSKTFEQAMADMAKGVLKSLVTESIVQTIVETARGIASLASYDYGGAALHFAAAGTWAAVGGVAGAVGAATGAFGGAGSGAAAGGAANARAAASTNSSTANGGSTTIYINTPPGLLTSAERGVFLGQAFQAARRQGYRVAA